MRVYNPQSSRKLINLDQVPKKSLSAIKFPYRSTTFECDIFFDAGFLLGSIISRCSGKELALLP